MPRRNDLTDEQLLDAKARLPQQVVYRPFVKETVVLNLQTGKYHGLNPTAGRMLELMERADSVRAVAEQLATEFGLGVDEVAADVCALCRDLLDRELLDLEGPSSGPR